jgi:eukaryotic-like serine/threonine-protein kinase
MLLAPGTQLGPYRILDLLGGGGMGEVYKATDTRLGRTVAVKVLQGRLAESAAHRERFEREARLISQLNHPHICTLHDVGTDQGMHYLVMEYVDGMTLESRLRQGSVSGQETIAYATQIADALAVAHRQGIVHRDLKPANIMLTRSGVKLLDFGLAKLGSESAAAHSDGRTGSDLTEQGTILGTTQYMAPEQLEGKEADARTDIFAFGAIVYEMLTGKHAFEGGSKASLIAAILKDTPRRISAIEPSVTPGLESTILRCLAKDPDDRWQNAGDLLFQLRADSTIGSKVASAVDAPEAAGTDRARPRWRLATTAVLAAAALAIGGFVLVSSKQARTGATPENLARLEALIDNAEWERAYALAEQIETASPGNPDLGALERRFTNTFAIKSEPSGAHVFRRPYEGTDDDWVELGKTPIRDLRLPIGLSRIRLEYDGYEPLLRNVLGGVASATREKQGVQELNLTLDRKGALPAGTVRVPGWRATIQGAQIDFADFFIGKYEVTNREYKEFVDHGGYQRPEFWEHAITKDGSEIPWQEAMKLFTDQTGLPGPSTWSGGDYPDGQEDYPVGGVSWYEAAAFAKFAGAALPTVYHWRRALNDNPVLNGIQLAWVLPKSNLEGHGPAPVGRFDDPTWPGVYDMAGNVREWTRNAVGDDRFALGGGWNDNRYMGADSNYKVRPLDRSAINGLRLALLRDEQSKLAAASAAVPLVDVPNWSAIAAVSDETFEAYRSLYAYEPAPLRAASEATETFRSWTRERITFDAGYDGARMVLYLYLPLNGSPPYQTVMYFPAAEAWITDSAFGMPLEWLIKSGRAVAAPVLRGTYERRDGLGWMGSLSDGAMTVPGRDAFVKVVKDARRSVDYLTSRPDIDADHIGYYGVSIGSSFAPQILALEPRFRVAVLSLAGLFASTPSWRPELRPTAFLPRVTIPVLVFSGDLDTTFPLETAAKPFFEMLGTPIADKQQIIVPGGHAVLTNTQARKTIEFLEQRFGPVINASTRER